MIYKYSVKMKYDENFPDISYEIFYDIGTFLINANPEYEPNMIKNTNGSSIDYTTYISLCDIESYIINTQNVYKTKMNLVLLELMEYHNTKQPKKHIKSKESEVFSLSSDDTDNVVFKYYISEDDIYIDDEMYEID